MSDKDENESAILRLDESMSLDEPEEQQLQQKLRSPQKSATWLLLDLRIKKFKARAVRSVNHQKLAQGQEVDLTRHVGTPDQSEEGLLNTMVHGDMESSNGDVKFVNVKY